MRIAWVNKLQMGVALLPERDKPAEFLRHAFVNAPCQKDRGGGELTIRVGDPLGHESDIAEEMWHFVESGIDDVINFAAQEIRHVERCALLHVVFRLKCFESSFLVGPAAARYSSSLAD